MENLARSRKLELKLALGYGTKKAKRLNNEILNYSVTNAPIRW